MRPLHLKRVPYVEQMRQTECGLCCVAMILQYYNSHEGIRTIRKELDVGRDGLKLSLLSNYLQQRKMETKIYKSSSSALTTLSLPAVIFWNQEHFVVLEKIKNDKYYIVDPAFGRTRYCKETFDQHFSGIVMTAIPTANFCPYKSSANLWVDCFKNININKKVAFGIFSASILTYLLQLTIPLFVERIIDQHETITPGTLRSKYFPLIVLIGALFAAFSIYRGQRVITMQIDIDQHLTRGTFRKLLHLPYKFFESRTNGDLLFRLDCLTTIRDLVSEQIVQGIIQFGLIVIILSYMLSKSVTLTIIALLLLIINIYYISAMQRKLEETNQYAIRANTAVRSIQVESIYSIFGIKISGMEDEILQAWDEKYSNMLKMYRKKTFLQNMNETIIQAFQLFEPLVLLLVGIRVYQTGHITMGEIIATYTFSGTLFSSSASLFSIWTDFRLATSYLERISDILDEDEEYIPNKPIALTVSGEIDIVDLCFSYNKKTDNVLNNITIRINPGEKVAIVGTSGSGKSTLSKLLLGLYQANHGNIYFDKINLEYLDKRCLRKQIGVVPQDMSLFNKTIYENIAIHQPNASPEEVKQAACIAQLDDEIEAMPMKYNTLVSEMGRNLSGGQRQRVALARALINKPKILILDEATSALDNVNEQKVAAYLKDIQCTRIVIAHRLSTIVDADKIIVLDKGIIQEYGTHSQLLEKQGVYYSLYCSQMSDKLSLSG